VGLHLGVVMGSKRECGATCGSGDGEWEGGHGVLDGRGRVVGKLRGVKGPW